MTEIKLTDIKWGTRSRIDYGDIQELSESIKRLGLIQPIVLDDDNKLLAGGRRITAYALLDKTAIPFVRLSDLSPIQKLEVELEENIRRQNFTWSEEVKLKKTITDLKRLTHPEWTSEEVMADSAKLFGTSTRDMYRDIKLAEAIYKNPELLKEKDKAIAISKDRRLSEIKLREIALSISPSIIDSIKMGDAVDLIKDIPDQSIDLILFDPPYGVEFSTESRLASYHTVYGDLTDMPEDIYKLNESIVSHFPRILKPNGHCYIFCASQTILRYHLYDLFMKYLQVDPYFLFWIKQSADNKVPFNKFAINYEPFFFCHLKDSRKLIKPHMATFVYNSITSVIKQHPAQKPLNLYKDLIELSTIEGEVVLDPMMGSGVSLVAAKQLNRKVIGFECIKEWYELSKYNIDNYSTYKEGGIK